MTEADILTQVIGGFQWNNYSLWMFVLMMVPFIILRQGVAGGTFIILVFSMISHNGGFISLSLQTILTTWMFCVFAAILGSLPSILDAKETK